MKRTSLIVAIIMISTYQVQAQSEDLQNQNLNNVNTLTINDPGINEGIQWLQTNSNWQLDVTPLNRSNADGNLNLFGQSNNVVVWRPLHIYSSTSGDAILKLEADSDNNNEGDNARIEMFQDGGQSGAYIGFNQDWGGSWEPDNLFRIGTRYSGVDANDRLVIKTSNGNVGIGVSNPLAKLAVDGFVKVEGNDGRLMLQNPEATGSIYLRNSGTQSQRKLEIMYGGTIKYVMDNDGNVGIGTTNPLSKLAVNGNVRATEVKVLADISVPDYVFEPGYELRTLKETKEYIAENKHLPEIPSAAEIGENGIDLGDMNMRLLKKIEELTLYQIELLERLEKAEEKIQQLETK